MEGSEDTISEEWDAKIEPIIKKALAEGRIPIECVEWVDMGPYEVKTIIYKEC